MTTSTFNNSGSTNNLRATNDINKNPEHCTILSDNSNKETTVDKDAPFITEKTDIEHGMFTPAAQPSYNSASSASSRSGKLRISDLLNNYENECMHEGMDR